VFLVLFAKVLSVINSESNGEKERTRKFSSSFLGDFPQKCVYLRLNNFFMHTVLLSIGSNTFAKTNIDKAKRMLTYAFPDIVFSPPVLTEPCGERYFFPFRNIIARFNCELTPQEIIGKIKVIEMAVGRSPRDKYLNRVIIDIDVIKCGDTILRPEEYEREYVQGLLESF